MIEWLERKKGSNNDDGFIPGFKVRISPSGKNFTINENLTKKLGDYCLVGFNVEAKTFVIKGTSSIDFNGKKIFPLKKGGANIRVNPTFQEFLKNKNLVGKVMDLTFKTVGGYFEEVKPQNNISWDLENVVNPKHYNIKALEDYCKSMNLDIEKLTEEQLKPFEIEEA